MSPTGCIFSLIGITGSRPHSARLFSGENSLAAVLYGAKEPHTGNRVLLL